MKKLAVEKQFEEALLDFVEVSPKKALTTLTGHFVGLVLALLEAEGHVPDGDIHIEGRESRNITIHAPKGNLQ